MIEAKKNTDFQTEELCFKLLTEQIEEEDTLNKIIKKVKSMGKNMGFYVKFDKTLGERK